MCNVGHQAVPHLACVEVTGMDTDNGCVADGGKQRRKPFLTTKDELTSHTAFAGGASSSYMLRRMGRENNSCLHEGNFYVQIRRV